MKDKNHHLTETERITALEANLTSLAENTRQHGEQISKLTDSVQKVVSSVQAGFDKVHTRLTEESKSIRDELAKSKATPWGTIIAGLSVTCTVIFAGVSALMYAVTTPTNIALANTQKDLNAAELRIDKAEASISSLRVQSKEDAVRFAWLADVLNQYRAHDIRMNGIMWKELFGDDLPALYVQPIGPATSRATE